MPFVSEAQRRYLYAEHPEIAKRFQKHTPKGAKLPEKKMEKQAYELGALSAFQAFGLEKTAFFARAGAAIGKGMQWAGKAMGVAPTGVGNAAGAVIGGIGGAVQGLAQGEGLKGMALRAGSGAISGALPMGAGMAAGMAMDAGINKMMAPKPAGLPVPGMR
jgi:hypothetical protein